MKFIEPQVFLIGETKVDLAQLKEMLNAIGGATALDWFSNTQKASKSEGELLTEVAGRICYRSFGVGLNPNITKIRDNSKDYINNTLAKGDGSIFEHATCTFGFLNVSRVFCYSEDTEVLTGRGWKRFDSIDGTEDFATLNPRSFSIEYLPATNYVVAKYNGRMIRIRSTMVDLLVTPNHRVFLFDYDKRSKLTKTWKFKKAALLEGRRFIVKTDGEWNAPDVSKMTIPAQVIAAVRSDTGTQYERSYENLEIPFDDYASFLGYFGAEGHVNHSTGTSYHIEISQNADSPHFDNVLNTIKRMGFSPTIYCINSQKKEMSIRFYSYQLYEHLKRFGRHATNKRVPPEIKRSSVRQIRLYLDAYMNGDGNAHKKNGHQVIHTSSKLMADDLQELALKAGLSASIRIDDRIGEKRYNTKCGGWVGQTTPNYVVGFRQKRGLQPMINEKRRAGRNQVASEAYTGRVYCVSVPPNELLYVRRNGKPVWCGNTHELVRHRAGTAMCLTGDTLIHSVHNVNGTPNGTRKHRLRDLFKMNLTPHGRSRIPLLKLRALDEQSNTFTTGKVDRIVSSGIKDVFEVELENGSKCKMSRDHMILTSNGWMRLQDLVQFIDVTPKQIAFYGTPVATVATNGYIVPTTALQLGDGTYAYRSKEWLEEKIRAGLTYAEMACISGVSTMTIKSWVQKRCLTGLSKSLKLYARSGNKGTHYKLGPMSEKRRRETSQRMRGEGNHRWRGGITPHPIDTELRESVLKRDAYHCRICNGNPPKHKLHIHHIDVYKPGKPTNSDPNNLITLCRRCRGRVTGSEALYAPYLHELLKAPFQLPPSSSIRHKRSFKPIFLRITQLKYCGKQKTYDIMMKGTHHNFIANGLIVHNSQESLRYVRPSEFGLWLPPEFADKKAKVKAIVEDIEEGYKGLEREFDWNAMNFDAKKRATSALRRIAPDGMATSIIWTANHRTIRHVITMRTAESAEVEIRYVFDKVARIMKEKFPLIYADFDYTELPDKTRSWHPKFVKV